MESALCTEAPSCWKRFGIGLYILEKRISNCAEYKRHPVELSASKFMSTVWEKPHVSETVMYPQSFEHTM